MIPKYDHICTTLRAIIELIARRLTKPFLLLAASAIPLFALVSTNATEMPKIDPVALSSPPGPTALSAPAENLRGDPGNDSTTTYVIGDHLKIAFFERTDNGNDAIPMHPASVEYVERVELSGEYLVQENGCVFLPLLGSLAVAAQTPQQVQDHLIALYKMSMGRNAKVSIVLTEREPIYIVGSIKKPGTYRYTPGMTVMHAVALSDGLEGLNSDFSKAAESIREQERLERSAQHLKILLARQAVFIAERESRQPVAPKRLVGLTGDAAAQTLISKLVDEYHTAVAGREAQKNALEATIDAATKELEILRGRMTHIEASLKNRSEHFDTLNSMQQRGSLSENTMYQARNELSDVQERGDGVKLSIAQTEEKLSQAQHDKMKLEMDNKIELNNELTTIENEIAEENLTLLSGERLLSAVGSPGHESALTPNNVSFIINRRTAHGIQRLTVDAMSLLQAGDLLEINPLQSTGAALADRL